MKDSNYSNDRDHIFDLISEIEQILEDPGFSGIPAEGNIANSKEHLIPAVANVLSLPLSQAARILLISSLLGSSGGDLNCRFNELAVLAGLSERTAYRALKEIKQSGFFNVRAKPGTGVQISAEWLWENLDEGAKKILGSQ